MKIHDLKIQSEYFSAVSDGTKKFEIRKNDRNYQVGDFLRLREFAEGEYTENEIVHQVTYLTDYAQKPDYVVLSIEQVPSSFPTYLSLTNKEQEVFRSVIMHLHLYSDGGRNTNNTFSEIISLLIGDVEFGDYDIKWYTDLWRKENE